MDQGSSNPTIDIPTSTRNSSTLENKRTTLYVSMVIKFSRQFCYGPCFQKMTLHTKKHKFSTPQLIISIQILWAKTFEHALTRLTSFEEIMRKFHYFALCLSANRVLSQGKQQELILFC